MEADINNMTLNEYLMYEKNRNLARSYPSRKNVAPMRNRIYPDSNEEDEDYCSLPPLLPCFQTPQPCATLKPVHHNNHSKVDIETEGDFKKFSDIRAWYAIVGCVQYDKKCSNPRSAISDETIANLNAQIVGDDMVRVQVSKCMTWLDYDEHVDSLSMMDNEVGVTSPESTTQTLP
uniref:Uncharacterized protein n=1 Tax=Tanacetum cinerariifolium TaxID=118510 RepID=A0A6L2N1K0_TANCI|nr:hypothetical protein [Tanacetum cinerariifolium]